MDRSGGRYKLPADKKLLKLLGPGWAWEILRAVPAYQKDAEGARFCRRTLRTRPLLAVIEEGEFEVAHKWGLQVLEHPDRSYGAAAVFWRPDLDPSVLPIVALPRDEADRQEDVVDFFHLPLNVIVLKLSSGKEHVLLCDGTQSIQLQVLSGSVLTGPVKIAFQYKRFSVSDEEMLTMKRFAGFRRNHRFDKTLFAPHARGDRLLLALRTLDFVSPTGRPNYLAMAGALFREENVLHWTDKNDWIRSRLSRAFKEAQFLVKGGYVTVLSSANTPGTSQSAPNQAEAKRTSAK